MREERIEAANRSEAVAALKAQGIVPMRVEAISGAAAQRRRAQNGEGGVSRKGASYVLAVAFVILVGGGLWWWLAQPAPTPRQAPPKSVKAVPKVAEAVKAPEPTPKLSARKRHRKPGTVPSATAGVGKPPDLPMFAEAPRRYGEINGSNIWPRALFKTREENMIAGLLTAKPGSRVLANGFVPGEEERFLASLDIPVEFEDIDTPEERKVKEFMIEVKRELKEAVAGGEKITDIVQQLRDELNAQATYRDKLRMNHAVLMREGTPQEAEDFRQEANKILSEYGMDPIVLRSTQRARLGLGQ